MSDKSAELKQLEDALVDGEKEFITGKVKVLPLVVFSHPINQHSLAFIISGPTGKLQFRLRADGTWSFYPDESFVPERVHICGDPNDACDYNCMLLAHEGEQNLKKE